MGASPRHDNSFETVSGPLEYLWSDEGGARLAEFAIMQTGVTMETQMVYELVHRHRKEGYDEEKI